MAKTTLIFSQLRLRRDDGRTLRYSRAHFARLEGVFGLGMAAAAAAMGVGLLYLMQLSEEGGGVFRIIIPFFFGLIFIVGMIFGLVKLLHGITVDVDGDRREIYIAVGVGPLCKRRVFHASQIKHVAVGEAATTIAPTPDNETYYRIWLQFKDGHTPAIWPLDQSKKLDPPLSVARQIADCLAVPIEAGIHESARLHDAVTEAMPGLFQSHLQQHQPTKTTSSPPPVSRIEVRGDRSDRLTLMIHPMGLRATRSVWVRFLVSLPFLGFGAMVGLGLLLDPQARQEAKTGGVLAATLFSLTFVSIGLGTSISNIMKMWRKAVIDVGSACLTVRENLPIVSRTHRWSTGQIERITVDQRRSRGSSGGTPLAPPFRLLITNRDGKETKVLRGRSPVELAWIATQLSSRLNVPTNADQFATFKV